MNLAFDTVQIAERLRQRVPALRFVAGAVELAAVQEGGKGLQTPCAFILVAAEQGDPAQGLSSLYVQHVRASISVVLVVRNYASAALGEAAGADLLALQKATRAALLGWAPDIADTPIEFAASRLFDYDAGTLLWEEVYRTRYRIQITGD